MLIIFAPDWDYWLHLDDVYLWEGIGLTLNQEPRDTVYGDFAQCYPGPCEPANLNDPEKVQYGKRVNLATRALKLDLESSIPLKQLLQYARKWGWSMPVELTRGLPKLKEILPEIIPVAPIPQDLTPSEAQGVYILRMPEVMKRVGLSDSTIYDKRSKGEFPVGRLLSARARGWTSTEIDEWIAQRGSLNLHKVSPKPA